MSYFAVFVEVVVFAVYGAGVFAIGASVFGGVLLSDRERSILLWFGICCIGFLYVVDLGGSPSFMDCFEVRGLKCRL